MDSHGSSWTAEWIRTRSENIKISERKWSVTKVTVYMRIRTKSRKIGSNYSWIWTNCPLPICHRNIEHQTASMAHRMGLQKWMVISLDLTWSNQFFAILKYVRNETVHSRIFCEFRTPLQFRSVISMCCPHSERMRCSLWSSNHSLDIRWLALCIFSIRIVVLPRWSTKYCRFWRVNWSMVELRIWRNAPIRFAISCISRCCTFWDCFAKHIHR